jgi:hypothetical protein
MIPTPFTRPLAIATVCAITCLSAFGGEEPATTQKFSNPGKPGTLKVSLARGDVRIHGADTQEITVKTEAQPQHHVRKDGLRVLTESATYSLTEKDNVATLDAASDGWVGTASDFDITVPRNTSIVINSALGGDITCAGVTGDIDIKSLHGEVHLTDLIGAALVETLNGEIHADIREVHDGKALSFTSMNGQVLLRVPATTKANVRLRTQNGTILTDFDDKALVTKVESVGGHKRGFTALTPEMRDAFREAGRAAKVATEQAAKAMREAAEAARQGIEGDEPHPGPGAHPTPEVPAVPMHPVPAVPAIPPVTGGKLVSGALNGGGPEINVATMNGDVILRRLEK